MSTTTETGAVCASCGDDKKKLKKCGACDLVRYCGVECQRNHRSEHKRVCKKRAAELKDEILFKQPESTDLGDCPICLLPIPIDNSPDRVSHAFATYRCCSKIVCNGCSHANLLRAEEAGLERTCPFCRHPRHKTEAEENLLKMKRVEANDPVALDEEGACHFNTGDHSTAIHYLEKAAGLGHIQSHYHLSCIYEEGTKKYMYHLEQAAIGGHPIARHNLGLFELEEKRNIYRAKKHWIIAAKLGCDLSIEKLKILYEHAKELGVVSKEEFAKALRAHYDAVEATKSPQRDAAEAARKAGRYW